MADLVKQLAEQVAGHSVWALLTTLVSVTIATLISKKLDARWKHAYERDIELLKARLAQDRIAIDTAVATLGTVAAASHGTTLKAIETLWDAMLKLGRCFSGVTLYADILTEEEWCRAPSDERRNIGMVVPSRDDVHRFVSEELNAAEHTRPFVGEAVWSNYFVYRAFILRVVTISQMHYESGTLPPWIKDKGIQKFMQLMLTDDELRAIEQERCGQFTQIKMLAESKLLAELHGIIAGQRIADSGLTHARKILQCATAATANNLQNKVNR